MFDFIFFFNSVLLGVGLAMDAFSVSIANGLNDPHMSLKKALSISGMFLWGIIWSQLFLGEKGVDNSDGVAFLVIHFAS